MCRLSWRCLRLYLPVSAQLSVCSRLSVSGPASQHQHFLTGANKAAKPTILMLWIHSLSFLPLCPCFINLYLLFSPSTSLSVSFLRSLNYSYCLNWTFALLLSIYWWQIKSWFCIAYIPHIVKWSPVMKPTLAPRPVWTNILCLTFECFQLTWPRRVLNGYINDMVMKDYSFGYIHKSKSHQLSRGAAV